MLMEAREVGNVHHACLTEHASIGPDDRRAVVGVVAIALKKIEDYDHTKSSSLRGKNLRSRPWDGFGKMLHITGGRDLGIERFKCQLCEADYVGALPGCLLKGLQAPGTIGRSFIRGGLLDERNLHD